MKKGSVKMAFMKNEDLEILKDIELYLYNINRESYVEQNGIFAIRKADIKDEKALELYFKLYSIIEENSQKRKKLNEKSTEYNKRNKKYHNISNNLYQARKSKNTKRIEYWENEMKLYKEMKGKR